MKTRSEKLGKVTLPKRCIKSEADMLKNPTKATSFYSDSRDRTFNVLRILEKGWPVWRALRCHWSGFFIISASQLIIIFATDGFIPKKI